jgi:hypothetical protein
VTPKICTLRNNEKHVLSLSVNNGMNLRKHVMKIAQWNFRKAWALNLKQVNLGPKVKESRPFTVES